MRSIPTLRKYFDLLTITASFPDVAKHSINLVFDATYFGRGYGLLIFRAQSRNVYWQVISHETLAAISNCFKGLENQGFTFKSFTIDDRRGVIKWLESCYSHVPIQLCHFHQVKTIRAYTTRNPKTDCGKELYALVKQLTQLAPDDFKIQFERLQTHYHDFLKERNEQGQFMHRRLRSAFRSLKTNLPYLFTYKLYPELAIPNTTNSCDGSFAHWRQKVKIHRGLRIDRREKMIHFLLSNS